MDEMSALGRPLSLSAHYCVACDAAIWAAVLTVGAPDERHDSA